MKAKLKQHIAQTISRAVPSLYLKGRLLAAVPRGRILRGFFLENSSDPDRIYVWTFVQPLYTPAKTLAFNLGMRLGGPSTTWATADSERLAAVAAEEGVAFFGTIRSPEAVADWKFLETRSDAIAREARAYSLVAANRFQEAFEVLSDLTRAPSVGSAWMEDLKVRANRLASLGLKDPKEAQALLLEWQHETIGALGVDDIP